MPIAKTGWVRGCNKPQLPHQERSWIEERWPKGRERGDIPRRAVPSPSCCACG